jgi:type III secretion system low calcium response chaperone LcrH/SycD
MQRQPNPMPEEFSKMSIARMTSAVGGAHDAAAAQIKETLTMIFEALKRGVMPKKALGMSEETIEALYTQAYNLYNQGKYNDAAYIFIVLMMLDPTVPKHVLGCAACLHRMGKYEKAAQLYILCSTLDAPNPLPYFHAADCYIKLKALPIADMCLKNTLERCGKNPEHALIRERAELMLKAVDDEIISLGGFPGVEGQSSKPQ